MNNTLELVTALAKSRAQDYAETSERQRRAEADKYSRWDGCLGVLSDYGDVDIELPTEDITHGEIIVFLRDPYRRLLLSEGSSWSSGPCILERCNGYPVALSSTPSGLVLPLLGILADHLLERQAAHSLPVDKR